MFIVDQIVALKPLMDMVFKIIPFLKIKNDIKLLKIRKSHNGYFKFHILNRSKDKAIITKIKIKHYSSLLEDEVKDVINYNIKIEPRDTIWIDYPIKRIEKDLYLFEVSALIYGTEVTIEKWKKIWKFQ